MDTKYHKALSECCKALAEVESNDRSGLGCCFFRLGVVFSRLGDFEPALRCFNDAFLVRDSDSTLLEEPGSEWQDFHNTQMAMYILGKKHKWISSLAEGDMVHELIKTRWHELREQIIESDIPLACADRHDWFRTVNVEFPWDVESIQSVTGTGNGPFDPLEDEFLAECVKITQ
ncbi:MAG: tetratricopeptide repeat protein [Sphaerochaetaceae bacterium]